MAQKCRLKEFRTFKNDVRFGGKVVGSTCLSIFVKLFHTYLPKSPFQILPVSVLHKEITKQGQFKMTDIPRKEPECTLWCTICQMYLT